MSTPTRRQFIRAAGAGAAALAARPVFASARTPGRALSREPAATSDVFLNYNENPYGPSPRALEAIHQVELRFVNRYYPEDTYDTLRAAIADYHGVPPDHVRATVGSTEVLKVCDDVFLSGRARLVVAEPAYEAVLQYAANSRADATKVPLTADHRHDLARMAAATTAETGLVYVCNPNNPTGTIVRTDEIAAFMDRIPRSVPVLFDEAYAEFVDDPGYESAVRLVREGRNVVVAKTFSKIQGMAGMRIGYAVAKPELIRRIAPFTTDFAITGAAANAAAAALADDAYRAEVQRKNAAERSRFAAEMRQMGLECPESQANFAMVNLGRPVEPVIGALAKRRIRVGREFPSMPSFLRVTFGTAAEMEAFYQAFRSVMGA